MCCDALDSTNELSDFLLTHVSRFWCYFHEIMTCCCVLIFVNICMFDILTCVVWKWYNAFHMHWGTLEH